MFISKFSSKIIKKKKNTKRNRKEDIERIIIIRYETKGLSMISNKKPITFLLISCSLYKTGCFRLTKTMKRPGIIYLARYLRNNVCGEGNAPEVDVEGSFPFTNVALCYKQLVKIKKEERRKRYIG